MFKNILVAFAYLTVAFAIPEWRIIGGTDAEPGEFKSICSFRFFGKHQCGCSIIGKQWVLTASHCFDDLSLPLAEGALAIRAGTTELNDPNAKIFEVAEIIIHPGYHPYPKRNDIALLRLKEDINFDSESSIAAIDLQCTDDRNHTGHCISAGWGRTSNAGTPSNILQQQDSTFLNVKSCHEILLPIVGPISNEVICVASRPGEGPCFGDSGGPLIIRKQGEKDKLIGLTSFGPRVCGTRGSAVYTRVSWFCRWIKSVIEQRDLGW